MARDGARGRLLLVAPGDPAPHMKKVGLGLGQAGGGRGEEERPADYLCALVLCGRCQQQTSTRVARTTRAAKRQTIL